MIETKIKSSPLCNHSNHLFSHPICKNQTLLKKIANIVFHILTLGLPLAVHHIVAVCYASYSKTVPRSENTNLQTVAVNSIQQSKNTFTGNKVREIQPYSKLGEEALEFARKKLKEHPEITPLQFSAGYFGPQNTKQPINQEIATLTKLYFDVIYKDFERVLKQNKENPWSNQEVIKAADALMKVAYAISNLTLDDLKSFTENLSTNGIERSFEKALTEQDSYQYRTFYYCTRAYHNLRGAIMWIKDPWDENTEGMFYPEPDIIPEEHAIPFYQEGTVQNSWTKLYNDYCDRIRLYVDEKKLSDQRHLRWTQKDAKVEDFCRIPDTTPT